jgi:ABC-type nitrate/sulfonate/bicarbonate transport system substrate-binding protein
MESRATTTPIKRVLAVGLVSILAVAACGGGASPSPSSVPSTPPTAAVSEAPSASPDAAAQIAALKAKLQGKKVAIGTSAFPNSSIVGAYKTVDFLKSDFGLDVEFRVMDSDPLIAAMLSGQVQVGQLSLAGTANAVAAGANFVAFGGDDQKNLFLVASKDPIDSMEQLRGKPFGVTANLNQITGQTARKCLQLAGLDLEKDVQLIRFNNTGEATAAIRSGQVLGGISGLFRLTTPKLEDGDIYNILCKGWEANPQLSSVWMADTTWLNDNKDFALAMNIASLESARWARANKDAWIALDVSTVENMTPEVAAIDYQNMVVEIGDWPVNGSLDQALCDSTLKISFEFKAIDKEYKCSDLVTFDYQDQAVEILGKQ